MNTEDKLKELQVDVKHLLHTLDWFILVKPNGGKPGEIDWGSYSCLWKAIRAVEMALGETEPPTA